MCVCAHTDCPAEILKQDIFLKIGVHVQCTLKQLEKKKPPVIRNSKRRNFSRDIMVHLEVPRVLHMYTAYVFLER